MLTSRAVPTCSRKGRLAMSFACSTQKASCFFPPVSFLPWAIVICFAILAVFVPSAYGQNDFTIIALPDTQYYSETYPQTFTAQTQWIVNNASALNIQAVVGLGDIVQTATNAWEYQNADA